MQTKFIATVIIALLNIFLGFVILKKNKKSPNNIFYCGLCFTGGTWGLFMACQLIITNLSVLEKIILPGMYTFAILSPLFYLLFAYHFPFRIKFYPKLVTSFIYVLSLILATLTLIGVFKTEHVQLIGEKIVHQNIFYSFLFFSLYFFSYVLWGFIILLKKLFNSSYVIYFNQLRFLITATIVTFCVIGTVSIILPLFNNFTYDWLGPIFLLIHFIFAGYLIFIKPLKIVRE